MINGVNEEILTCLILIAIGYFIAKIFSGCANSNGFRVGGQGIIYPEDSCEKKFITLYTGTYKYFFNNASNNLNNAGNFIDIQEVEDYIKDNYNDELTYLQSCNKKSIGNGKYCNNLSINQMIVCYIIWDKN
tara:strand:- start:83 stop:478 length:396 start_codon:yes stop_codon:yes gene_type:complete